jgi:hypothetical protein
MARAKRAGRRGKTRGKTAARLAACVQGGAALAACVHGALASMADQKLPSHRWRRGTSETENAIATTRTA